MPHFRRVSAVVVACVLAGLAAPARAAEPDKLLPDDTDGVLTLNVRQFLDAPLVKKHCVEWFKKYLTGKAEVQAVLDSIGFDPLKDVATVTAAGPSTATDSDKALIIVHGRFDVAKLHAKAVAVAKEMDEHLKVHDVGGVTVYEVRDKALGDDKPMFVGLVDSTTLVASGSRDYVVDAFARHAGKKASNLKKEVKDLIVAADANQSLWMVGLGSPLPKNHLALDDKARKSLEKIESVTAGVTVSEDVKAEMVVATKGFGDAKELAADVEDGLGQAKGILTLLAGDQGKLAPLIEFLGTIKTTTSGNNVVLKSEVPAALLEKVFKAVKAE
jgi:hypothetical protein